jgi:peptidoglycan hydrolase-like protein with peptidoglycan-binding domain
MKKSVSLSIALLAVTCIGAGPVWSAQTRTNPTEQVQKGPIDSDTGGGMSQPGSGTADQGTSGTERNSGKSQSGTDSSNIGRSSGSSGMGSSSMSERSSGRTDVRSVQEALKGKGFDPGPVDGVMGPKTQAALRAFQQSSSLSATGRLDAQTAQQLGIERSTGSMGNSPTGRSGSTGMGSGQSSGSSTNRSGNMGDSGTSTGSTGDTGKTGTPNR